MEKEGRAHLLLCPLCLRDSAEPMSDLAPSAPYAGFSRVSSASGSSRSRRSQRNYADAHYGACRSRLQELIMDDPFFINMKPLSVTQTIGGSFVFGIILFTAESALDVVFGDAENPISGDSIGDGVA